MTTNFCIQFWNVFADPLPDPGKLLSLVIRNNCRISSSGSFHLFSGLLFCERRIMWISIIIQRPGSNKRNRLLSWTRNKLPLCVFCWHWLIKSKLFLLRLPQWLLTPWWELLPVCYHTCWLVHSKRWLCHHWWIPGKDYWCSRTTISSFIDWVVLLSFCYPCIFQCEHNHIGVRIISFEKNSASCTFHFAQCLMLVG